jgi:hypothetical protein
MNKKFLLLILLLIISLTASACSLTTDVNYEVCQTIWGGRCFGTGSYEIKDRCIKFIDEEIGETVLCGDFIIFDKR